MCELTATPSQSPELNTAARQRLFVRIVGWNSSVILGPFLSRLTKPQTQPRQSQASPPGQITRVCLRRTNHIKLAPKHYAAAASDLSALRAAAALGPNLTHKKESLYLVTQGRLFQWSLIVPQ